MVNVNPWAVLVLLLLAAALVALVEYGSRKADRADREWFAEQERSRGGRRGASRLAKKRPEGVHNDQ